MIYRKKLVGILGGLAAAAIVSSELAPLEQAEARTKRRSRRSGAMRLVEFNVDDFAGIPLNRVIEMRFSQNVAPGSVSPAHFQIRAENATATGFTRQIPGDFQVVGNIVRFFPRLPTHLRDETTGDFYDVGSARDDAAENAGLQPSTNYQIRVVGHPSVAAVRSTRGRKLVHSEVRHFTTAAASPAIDAYTLEEYADAPPPALSFSNPPDKVASAFDQYSRSGGTQAVPNQIAVTLFANKVPLNPSTVRQGSNVSLTLLERQGDTGARKPIQGTPFVEQNFDTMRMVFQPRFALPDVGTYALRVTRDVRDLTGLFNFASNAERLRLRSIYEFLDTARRYSPGVAPELLTDPPVDLAFDWPQGSANTAVRGILKRNLLELGDSHPDEVDPRVMVLFSTRDEPVSSDELVFSFQSEDGLFHKEISTGRYDEEVEGAASAILTVAGGSGINGDFKPGIDTVISGSSYPGGVINWRNVDIPPNVKVTITGDIPVTVKAYKLQIDGTLSVDGANGGKALTNGNYYTSLPTDSNGNPLVAQGGDGGPGGGDGGDSAWKKPVQSSTFASDDGEAGNDVTGTVAAVDVGGQGGKGGLTAKSSAYSMGGAGGGGGARTAGKKGSDAKYPTGSYGWNGIGGNGGVGSSNDELNPLVGGAGGGAGGNGGYSSQGWVTMGAGGGGGGGAILLQSPDLITIGSAGMITARGGRGGSVTGGQYTTQPGPAGGGGGGSILLRSTSGFNITNPPSALIVLGGAGGTSNNSYAATPGGSGGAGYIRLEDPNGGLQVPGGSVGGYNPVGGGSPSVVYTYFADIPVEGPRFLNFTESSFELNAGANDAVLIEMQMAIEDPDAFGEPLLTALAADQGSTNQDEVSQWLPIRLLDNSGIVGGAFGPVNGYDQGQHGNDYVFPIADEVNGRNFKFIRLRITFQLDDTQTFTDPLPFVDRVAMAFEFNI